MNKQVADIRQVAQITQGIAASDGAGVKLTRLIGHNAIDYLDPFLMLDRFESDNPNDYLAGFPSHPHRGFETVTYLVNGKMRHKDNRGHEGIIETGGVQWMTAGKGIIHSEMPEQTDGLLKGFQLWVNLPAKQKMVEPTYQEFKASELGYEKRQESEIKIITGKTANGAQGPVKNDYIEPLFWHVSLAQNALFEEPISYAHTAFLVVLDGSIKIGTTEVEKNQVAVLTSGELIQVQGTAENNEFLLISAEPINEPIARGGPFVMNTSQEVEQAFDDYRHGRF